MMGPQPLICLALSRTVNRIVKTLQGRINKRVHPPDAKITEGVGMLTTEQAPIKVSMTDIDWLFWAKSA
jgi:hypothetical protein